MNAPKKQKKFEVLHEEVWAGRRPDRVPTLIQDMASFLTVREQDVVLFDHTTRREEWGGAGSRRVLDVSQSIHRCPGGTNLVPAVTPGARLLLVELGKDGKNCARLLGGFEHLRLQGLDKEMLSKAGQENVHLFAQRDLKCLAGNAFCSNHIGVVAAVMLAIFEFPSSVVELEDMRQQAF